MLNRIDHLPGRIPRYPRGVPICIYTRYLRCRGRAAWTQFSPSSTISARRVCIYLVFDNFAVSTDRPISSSRNSHPQNHVKVVKAKQKIPFGLPAAPATNNLTKPASTGSDQIVTPAFPSGSSSTLAPPIVLPSTSVLVSKTPTSATAPSTHEQSGTNIPPPIPTPRVSGPSHAPAVHIPKAFTDKVTQQARKIAELEAQQLKLRCDLDAVTAGCKEMGKEFGDDVDDLDNEQKVMEERIDRLENTVKKQSKIIDLLLEKLESKGGDVHHEEPAKASSKANVRDNLLNVR
ncbi:hypothetical protein B0H13DRAFT_1862229 [Mycena leptocephala]|nr:hypothetical protein B0H13DRAFT_1862229 [Mycena leptocephala]